jgi:RNA polymerase sigma factor (TIGR02999 family)
MSEADTRGEVTRLLLDLGPAALEDRAANERLMDLLYAELHRIATRLLSRERSGHTIQPTALVNEAYLRLVDQNRATYQSRVHFLKLAARTMRRILVDYARKTRSSKRGGALHRVPLDDAIPDSSASPVDLLTLDRVLRQFSAEDPRAAQVVELRVFAGLKVSEVAKLLGVSDRTVDNDWAVARMWLARAVEAGEDDTGSGHGQR